MLCLDHYNKVIPSKLSHQHVARARKELGVINSGMIPQSKPEGATKRYAECCIMEPVA